MSDQLVAKICGNEFSLQLDEATTSTRDEDAYYLIYKVRFILSSSFERDPHFQMLAVVVLSQHRVSTCKTVSPRIPVGARCSGHVRMMCSAVCSAAPHSQFDVGARPHLCMND